MRKFFFQLGLVFFTLVVFPLLQSVFSASLQFEPTSASLKPGETVQIKLKVDAGTEQILAVDAYVLYDANLFQAQSVLSGNFFPTVINELSQPGRAYVAGLIDDPAGYKTGSGTVATITLAAKNAGRSTLVFDCQPNTETESNILKNDASYTDIIDCRANSQAVLTLAGGQTPTPSPIQPSPTPAAVSANRSSPTRPPALPRSGLAEVFFQSSIAAGFFLIMGILVRLIW